MAEERTNHTRSLLAYPEKWTDKYSQEDKDNVRMLIDWINEGQEHDPGYANQRSLKKLGTQARMAYSTVQAVTSGVYVSPPTQHITKLLEAMRLTIDRSRAGHGHEFPFVETSVYRTVIAAAKRAQLYRNFSVVSAYVGTGKTYALKKLIENNDNVILIEATPDMNAGVLVSDLAERTSAVVHKSSRYSSGTKAEKMRGIITALKGSDTLIILDEAETVTGQTLEYLRRIRDQAEVGVLLTGTEKLGPLVRDPRGRFGQISSRVGFWPKTIRAITEDDAAALTEAGLGMELEEAVLDAFWQMCDGSARVLCDALIPGVRDYGTGKGMTLTPELVFKIGEEVLGFRRPARRVA